MKKIWTADYCIQKLVHEGKEGKYDFQTKFLRYLYQYAPKGKVETCYDICYRVAHCDVEALSFWFKLNRFQKNKFIECANLVQEKKIDEAVSDLHVVTNNSILIH